MSGALDPAGAGNSTRSARSGRVEERLAQHGGIVELLRIPAALFAVVGGARRALYDRGWLPRARLEAPVVSVGNLSAGGTGKTPMVAWLVREFERRGRRVGIASRGYGARIGERNDEALLLAQLAPNAPHVLDHDRVRGGRALVAQHVDVVVLDDGFQHRRLRRDLDLVLIDATQPWGLPGRSADAAPLLPRGLLREPPSALARADVVVLTRADHARPADLVALRREIEMHAPGVPLAIAWHRASRLRSLDGSCEALDLLHGREVDVVSAIGNPEAFERTLAALGARVGTHRRFPDHHAYVAGDMDGLACDGRTLVTTAKDAVKLNTLAGPLAARVRIVDIDIEIAEGAAVLAALLDSLPQSRSTRERAALHEGLHG